MSVELIPGRLHSFSTSFAPGVSLFPAEGPAALVSVSSATFSLVHVCLQDFILKSDSL